MVDGAILYQLASGRKTTIRRRMDAANPQALLYSTKTHKNNAGVLYNARNSTIRQGSALSLMR
jgi:hypothetical protein